MKTDYVNQLNPLMTNSKLIEAIDDSNFYVEIDLLLN